MATYWENSCSFGLRYVSWYKYLIVSLVFSHLGFWSGNLFLIAPFPDLCLLVPFFFKCNLLAQRYITATQRVRPPPPSFSRKLKLSIPVFPHPRCCTPTPTPHTHESQLRTCYGILHLFEYTTLVFNVDMPTIYNKIKIYTKR